MIDFRLLRGGSWSLNPRFCRSASRYYLHSDFHIEDLIGFRVICRDPAGHSIQMEDQTDG